MLLYEGIKGADLVFCWSLAKGDQQGRPRCQHEEFTDSPLRTLGPILV